MKKNKIIGQFKPYEYPKLAIYYGGDGIKKKALVIGEDQTLYVEELRPVSPTHNSFAKKTHLLPLGFHKSRLIRFLPTQIDLFK